MYTRESGKMIKLTVMVLIHTLMEPSIKEPGLMINRKEKVLKFGLMVLNMKDNMSQV